MYDRPSEFLEKCRIKTGRFRSTAIYGNNGAFIVPGPEHHKLFMIASDEDGWQHVSVSLVKKHRLPTWGEMCFAKNLWWPEEEEVVQFHPRKSEYVNFAEALHLWRPNDAEIPLPNHTMVGPKSVEETLELLAEVTGKKER